MTDSYDGNGDYSYTEDDNEFNKVRKVVTSLGTHNGDGSGHTTSGNMAIDSGQLNEKANEYIRDCMTEKSRLDRKFPIAEKLLDCEIEKVQSTGRILSREQKYADVYREKPLRISQKVLVPIREHPKFNFVGKLLGPKGNSLRRLQEETLCKMTVLGRNSMRDRVKEEELRSSKDPKYAHLNSDLHVEISTIATPAEAYARIAYAMAELRKYLIPDSNDVIRQEQLRELMDNTTISENDGAAKMFKKTPLQGTTGFLNVLPNAEHIGNPSGSIGKSLPYHGAGGGGYRPSQQTSFGKNNVAPKQKVLSILEKARSAMEETYGRGYEHHMTYEQPSYDGYTYGHQPAPHNTQGAALNMQNAGSRGGYENHEYDTEYGRRDYYQHSPTYGGNSQSNPNVGLCSGHNRSHVNR